MRMFVDITLIITMWIGRVIILFIFNIVLIQSKRYETRCKMVRDFLREGVANDIFLGQWVCLAEKVSNRDTSALVISPSGKKSYGIFQIPAKWCKEGKPGGECNMRCESFLDDDIKDDAICAHTIFQREGFKYWSAWEKRCKNDKLITTEIYKCPDLHARRSSPEKNHSEILRHRRMLLAKTMARMPRPEVVF